jgi:hypothetical protein
MQPRLEMAEFKPVVPPDLDRVLGLILQLAARLAHAGRGDDARRLAQLVEQAQLAAPPRPVRRVATWGGVCLHCGRGNPETEAHDLE